MATAFYWMIVFTGIGTMLYWLDCILYRIEHPRKRADKHSKVGGVTRSSSSVGGVTRVR